ncbi:hypothetical protein M0804_015368 [Polistes exclamans]|nr:hypothetical protein M0804_015368 [Polistes exclamans]
MPFGIKTLVDKLEISGIGPFLTFIQPSSSAENANTCKAPPQPDNGSRKLLNLESFTLSEVQEGTELPFESLLKYECKWGYTVLGSSIATCRSYGNWVNIPVCRAAGNIYPEYDSVLHDQQLVKKSRVFLLCLNDPSVNFSNGRIASFWHDHSKPRDIYIDSSLYDKVPFNECLLSDNTAEFERYKTMDKLCAVSRSRQFSCSGIDGSGLTFYTKKTNILVGIMSISLNAIHTRSTETCSGSPYSLFTRISSYIGWIRDIILQIEISNLLSSSRVSTLPTLTLTTPAPFIPRSQRTTTTSSPFITRPIVCKAPPQPANGNRQLHESQCQSQKDCDVQEGVELPPGSYLTYSCYDGYEISGTHDVLCSLNGKWINIPVCTEIHCDSLVSASTFADCTYNDA